MSTRDRGLISDIRSCDVVRFLYVTYPPIANWSHELENQIALAHKLLQNQSITVVWSRRLALVTWVVGLRESAKPFPCALKPLRQGF